MGKYGRMNMNSKTGTFKIENMTDKQAVAFVKECIKVLQGPLVKHLKESDTDLMNIRDEMLGDLNKLLYLFTLK